MDLDLGFESKTRDSMIRQLRQNLGRCRRVLLDENLDLKTRERWTQLYNNTSTVLNRILKDRQLREWEIKMNDIEEYEKRERGLRLGQFKSESSEKLDRPRPDGRQTG